MVIVTIVEKVQNESFYLNSVQIWEQSLNVLYQKTNHEVLIRSSCMGSGALNKDRTLDEVHLDNLKKLLKDLTLELETTHMSVVCEDCKDILNDDDIEVLVKDICNLGFLHDEIVQRVEGVKSNLHDFWFFMLHSEEDREDNCLELA